MARMAKQLLTSEGIIATPNPKPGKALNNPTANESPNFIKVTAQNWGKKLGANWLLDIFF